MKPIIDPPLRDGGWFILPIDGHIGDGFANKSSPIDQQTPHAQALGLLSPGVEVGTGESSLRF